MSIYDKIREQLVIQGITKEYSDNELNTFIEEAKILINRDFTEDTTYTDFKLNFKGKTYVTDNYPLKTVDEVSTFIDEVEIIPEHISKNGVIYFDKIERGKLRCEYVVGLTEEDMLKFIVPIVVFLVKETNGKNITSIHEGDLNITYSDISNQNIIRLIDELRNTYSARIKVI